MSWLREHVGRTWTEIRRLEAEIATLARDRRTVPEEDLAELKGALHLLQEREPAFDGLRGTAEFTAIFTPP
jgi:hypothetical protein